MLRRPTRRPAPSKARHATGGNLSKTREPRARAGNRKLSKTAWRTRNPMESLRLPTRPLVAGPFGAMTEASTAPEPRAP
jgi:hypothetical protein